ncbi:down syndrome cell adhesion molecule-like protein Dscam2 [Nephila pilipes]|uniref:Down syndrome cell adhesion molecule-like protein Dscam2 n=1 Tax=Nephila pilipes TaxID=299642 RepID=A0A8X6N181_NEPPI|nr:down syndrome cell adhesion molecule-like protein Dscam2 [Nephila pilipes]
MFRCILRFLMISCILGDNSLKIQPFSFPTESVIGKRVSATCTPSTGEKMNFKWLKNDKEITQKKQNINILSYPELSNIVINPLTSEDSGNYTCVVSTRGLSGSYTTVLNVLEPPSWKTIPQDYNAVDGETVVINCQGTGRPEPIISWYRALSSSNDYAPVMGLNRATLSSNGSMIISEISKDDEGIYKCNVTNGIGNDLVKAVIIKVTDTDAFKVQPFFFSPSSVIGKRVITTCTTTTEEKVEFRWLKNGQEITKNNKINVRSFPELSNLIIESLTEDDSGNYTCIASTRGILESYTATLEVLVPSTWKHMPQDAEGVDGDSVILNCQGTGKPEPTTFWSRIIGSSSEYVPLTDSPQHILHKNGSLVLVKIEKYHEGIYKCNVSNGIGNPLIKTTIVKVIEEGLKVQPFIFPASAIINQRVSTMCATVSAADKMEFRWFKNGLDLSKSNKVQILSFPEISSIIIDPLTEEDTGNYTCTVTSRGVSASYTASLHVLIPPSWKHKPVDIEVTSGETIFINCAGIGKPPPISKWNKLSGHETELSALQNSQNIQIHGNGTLEIQHISNENEGYYQCVVSNGVGSDLKRDINVKVIGEFIYLF